jgi:hypothetical protein
MPVIKSLLIRLDVETAAHQRICHRNRKKHAVIAGQVCLVTIDDMGGKKNYCTLCYAEMLDKAQADLEELKRKLGGPNVPSSIT